MFSSSAAAWETVAGAISAGSGIYSAHYANSAYKQANELHDRALEADVSAHFQSLSQDLYAAAKEADRDVWEQHNERFSNLTVLALLMLSVTVSLVTEGSYHVHLEDAEEERAWFMLFTSLAMVCLFMCLASAYRATNNMSQFMLDRSGQLSRRIHEGLGGDALSPTVQAFYKYRPNAEQTPGKIRMPTRDEMRQEVLQAPTANPAPDYAPTVRRQRSMGGQEEKFADFWKVKCEWLKTLAEASFVLGILCTVAALSILVGNEIQPAVVDWWLDPQKIFIRVNVIGIFVCALVVRCGRVSSSS